MTIVDSADGDGYAGSRVAPAHRLRDHWLVKRTRELIAVAQRGDAVQRSAAVAPTRMMSSAVLINRVE